ncbi:LysR family transcriptional regulator [Bradyrhizobium sp. 62B]|uniref:LysR family transcriptional regulator n=1 Tax=Bradyrhizobium sp. 62B TaxID=2898442 RepID=UPI002012A7A5|nr:LysR family transcriptional regulator [Bradyrhizobium diazoefficiens]WIW48074.1 LysR family transcriptional regulator [Bradyrhizobium sp. 62B]
MMMPRFRQNLDIDLIRSFVTIVSLGNFTRAARTLGLQQSTISLQIRRLEQMVGGKLLERSPQAVALTPEGETFFDDARRMLDLNDEMVARIQEPAMRGLVRLGAPEDFATRHLPDVLARFAHAYPQVDLEVTCDLTMNLIERFRKGAFDLALIKRERSIEIPGTRVWREPLVWVTGGVDLRQGVLPLAVSPKPCVYRKRATEALDRARRSWRVAYTCGSLAGTLAAVRARLGVTVLPKDMVPPDLHVVDGKPMPDLKDTEIAILERDRLPLPAQRLKDFVIKTLS